MTGVSVFENAQYQARIKAFDGVHMLAVHTGAGFSKLVEYQEFGSFGEAVKYAKDSYINFACSTQKAS